MNFTPWPFLDMVIWVVIVLAFFIVGALVNTLGERRDQKAGPVLSEMRNSSDKVLSTAVEAALRKIAPPA